MPEDPGDSFDDFSRLARRSAGRKREHGKFVLLKDSREGRVLLISCAMAVLVVVVSAFVTPYENPLRIVLLGLAFLASELFALQLKPVGRVSLALFVMMIAVMHTGPLGVSLIPLFGIPAFVYEAGRKNIKRTVFNTAQYIASAGFAALVFTLTSGKALFKSGTIDIANAFRAGQGARLILPWFLATVVFFAFNTVLVASVVSGIDRQRVMRFWERRMMALFPGYLLYSGVGFLAAMAYSKLQFTAVVLISTLLLGVRVVYTRYSRTRKVCDQTSLAVTEAIESMDCFEEGHGAGVAEMAVAIGEEMELSDEDIHLLRLGALFHDLGKLAVDVSILKKPGLLTIEEYEQVKMHPQVSASILAGEESLSAVAPSVMHHHEMPDGCGYVDGLSGETIPLGARILLVADAFDAMQRPSEYREPRHPGIAASEIVRAKGIQFDPEVVDAFVKVAVKKGIWSGALGEEVPIGEEMSESSERITASESGQGPTAPLEAQEAEVAAAETRGEPCSYSQVRELIEKDIHEWRLKSALRRRLIEKGRAPKRRVSEEKKGKEGRGRVDE